MKTFSMTDAGRRREVNQDYIYTSVQSAEICTVCTRKIVGGTADFRENFFGHCHGSRGDRGNALAKLILGNGAEGFLGSITAVASHASVKMNISQARNHISVVSICNSFLSWCGEILFFRYNSVLADINNPRGEKTFLLKNLPIDNFMFCHGRLTFLILYSQSIVIMQPHLPRELHPCGTVGSKLEPEE